MMCRRMTRIEKLVKEALSLFRKLHSPAFQDSVASLLSAMKVITLRDVNLSEQEIFAIDEEFGYRNKSGYCMKIFEDDNVSVSIFIINARRRIPLHDHPAMYGFLKMLYGTVSVQQYTVLGDDASSIYESDRSTMYTSVPLPVQKHKPVTLTAADDCFTLTPDARNLHEILAVGDKSAAFIDVLFPPYGTPITPHCLRHCTYFKELNDGLLSKIDTPRDYDPINLAYTGPPVRIK